MKVLEWHCTFPEIFDLTLHVADDLTCSGFCVLTWHIRGAFGKFLAWSFISVTDLQTLPWADEFLCHL